MRNEVQRMLDRYDVLSQLQVGETVEDLATMFEVIVEARQQNLPSSDIGLGAEIAALSLCWLVWPGKPPSYSEQVRELRLGFRGIAYDESMRSRFESLLGENLLTAQSYDELDFSDVTNIFREDSEAGEAVHVLADY